MKIYISEKLNSIYDELKKRGYEAHTGKTSYGDTFDAIICNLKNGDLNNMDICNGIKIGETVIIDYGRKNIEDIENILSNKIINI